MVHPGLPTEPRAPERAASDAVSRPCAAARMTHALRRLGRSLLLGLAVAACGLAMAENPRNDADRVVHLTQAVRADAASLRFPADVPRQAIELPHPWRTADAPGTTPVWYRLTFDLPSPPAGADDATGGPLLAAELKRACGRLWIVLNGELLMADPADSDAGGRLCREPRLLPLPPSMLKPQGNELDIRMIGRPLENVTSRASAAGLWPVAIGPHDLLSVRHARERDWQRMATEATGLSLALLGLFVAAMGWLNRRDGTFVYFGLLALAWGAITMRAGTGGDSIGPLDGQWLQAAALAPTTALAVIFLLRHAGWHDRRVDAALLFQCAVMPLALLVASPRVPLFTVALGWYAVFALQTMVAAAFCVHRLAQRDGTAAGRTAAVLAIAAVLVAAELAVQVGWLALPGAQVARVGLALLLLAVAVRFILAFADALRAAEAARLTMEARVAEATAEIEHNFSQLAELRVEQVTEKERKRIAADLHDDLGAKLLTIVHTSESERISTLAREALEEMRLSVRGLTGKPVRLADALADWRAETVARLGQAGIEADWRSPTDEVEQRLAARTYVQTTRILREAVSNIIKHSGATHCKVRCTIGAEDFVLIIQDNGRGISTEMSGKLDRGQGMYSMKNRAKQLQGQCLVESGPGYGTVIRLTLPLTERASTTAQA